jgi:hypothetical protein
MAPAFVQFTFINEPSTSTNPKSFPAITNADGNFLVITSRNTPIISVTDTFNNSWVQAGAGNFASIWYAPNVSVGLNTVVVHFAAPSNFQGTLTEYSGVAVSSPLDQVSVSNQPSGTSGTTNVITTTQNGELIIVAIANETSNNPTYTGTGGFAVRDPAAHNSNTADFVQSTSGAISATINGGASYVWDLQIASFKAQPALPVSGAYSVPDSRVAPAGPNSSRTVNATKIYDVQTSSNPAIPPKDSRVSPNIPVDSRVSPNIPQNSRTPGTFGPGVN